MLARVTSLRRASVLPIAGGLALVLAAVVVTITASRGALADAILAFLRR